MRPRRRWHITRGRAGTYGFVSLDKGPVEGADRALAEAIHVGAPGGARSDRAVDTRILEQLCAALSNGGITIARLAAAAEASVLWPRADKFARVSVGKCRYSVPARLIGTAVRVRLTASELTVFDGSRADLPGPA